MPEYQVAVVAAAGPQVPARVTGLLLPPDITISSMSFDQGDGPVWNIQLAVSATSPERLALLMNRLGRLVDIQRVEAIPPHPGFRRRIGYDGCSGRPDTRSPR